MSSMTLTEYGDLMAFGSPAILDEWGRRRIDGFLEDGTVILITVAITYIDVSDSGLGADALSQFERSFLDSGLGEDVLSEFDRVFIDSGIGLDVSSAGIMVFLADSGIGVDSVSWSGFFLLADSGVGLDISLLEVQVSLADSGIGTDAMPHIELPIIDSGIGSEIAHNILHEWRTFVNIVERGLGVDLAEGWAGASVSDSGIGSEVIRIMWWKGIYVNISDLGLGVDSVLRDAYYIFQDKVKAVDVITKVAYKLTGKDVRRVYWHKIWRDIIEDTDHNVRIEVAKILLERMKHLKEELE